MENDQITFNGYTTRNFDFCPQAKMIFMNNIESPDGTLYSTPDTVPATMSTLRKMQLKHKILDV